MFRDLGIVDYGWIRDPSGTPYAMAGLEISAVDLAKLGELVLQGGVGRGRRVVPEEFAREAVRSQHDLYERHGLPWWLLPPEPGMPDGFRGDGWLGQWVVVIPGAELVAARLIDRGSWTGEADSFSDFRERVRALATAWAAGDGAGS